MTLTEDCPNYCDELLCDIKDCPLKCACLGHSLEFKRGTEITVNYYSHPKDGEGTVFTGACLCPIWGYPVL